MGSGLELGVGDGVGAGGEGCAVEAALVGQAGVWVQVNVADLVLVLAGGVAVSVTTTGAIGMTVQL